MPGTPAPTVVSVEELFLQQLQVIEQVIASTALRHHMLANAEDFASFVKLKLIDDNYACLRAFGGRSTFRSYIAVVVRRLLLDFQNALWGKWRPSAAATRMGPTALLIERLMSRDGFSAEETFELLRTNFQVALSRLQFEALVARLPARVRRRFTGDTALETVEAVGTAADEYLLERDSQVVAEHIAATLSTLLASLSREERLLLAFRFEDGRTVADIAIALRVDQKVLYRRLDRLLRDLRHDLEREGINADAVSRLFESHGITFDSSGLDEPGIQARRPSSMKGAEG